MGGLRVGAKAERRIVADLNALPGPRKMGFHDPRRYMPGRTLSYLCSRYPESAMRILPKILNRVWVLDTLQRQRCLNGDPNICSRFSVLEAVGLLSGAQPYRYENNDDGHCQEINLSYSRSMAQFLLGFGPERSIEFLRALRENNPYADNHFALGLMEMGDGEEAEAARQIMAAIPESEVPAFFVGAGKLDSRGFYPSPELEAMPSALLRRALPTTVAAAFRGNDFSPNFFCGVFNLYSSHIGYPVWKGNPKKAAAALKAMGSNANRYIAEFDPRILSMVLEYFDLSDYGPIAEVANNRQLLSYIEAASNSKAAHLLSLVSPERRDLVLGCADPEKAASVAAELGILQVR